MHRSTRRMAPITVTRRIAAQQRQEEATGIPGTIGYNEMDTLVDTSCAGANWKILEPTGQICNVSGFMESGQTVKDIPVATCATIVNDSDSGQEIILLGHEMLYFGEKMKRSLINPNQLRYAGVKVRDDPNREKEE